MMEKAKNISKYYYNLHMSDNELAAVATTSNEHQFEEYFDLLNITQLDYDFTIEEGIVEDYLANDLGWPLLSVRMKTIFDQFNSIGVHWVKVKVLEIKSNENYDYYILVFKSKIDVINEQESERDDFGSILIPVFALTKIWNLDFFPQPDKYDFNLVISDVMKVILEKAKITGIDFSLVDQSI